MGAKTANRCREPDDGNAITIDVTIPSDYSAGRDVQKRILDEVEKHKFDTQSAFAIKLALEEAIINAIKHGNKLDSTKKVHIRARISPHQAEITIEDEGPGFHREQVPDPTADENLDKCSGRGILLMEAYMSCVEYSNQGRRIRLVKKNGDAKECEAD
jgi:serine/threonine-protein kinase RsbW